MRSWLRESRQRIKAASVSAGPQPYALPNSAWYPEWNEILYRDRTLWEKAIKKARKGPHILIATSHGGHVPSASVESTLAVALTLRGARVQLLLCDRILAGCTMAISTGYPTIADFVQNGPVRDCKRCFAPANEVYESLGLRVLYYSDYLTADAKRQIQELVESIPANEIRQFRLDGFEVGEHAVAGALRFFARGDLEGQDCADQVLKRYFAGALQATFVTSSLLDSHQFETACFNHGIYVPQGLITQVARKKNVHVVNWTQGYRKRRFLFTHNETYHHALMTEPTSNWEDIVWTPELEEKTRDYLQSRWHGTRDWIWFHEKPELELSTIAEQLGIDFTRPTIGLLTNVIWDAQLHYPANAFPTMRDWFVQTIQYFGARPELQLLIRIHPAENRGTIPSRQPVLAEIQKAFPEIPKNVFIIAPESNVSTYAAMMACNSVLIYGTKTGVELTSMGIPVVAAGEAWIRNKGITIDAKSPEEYFQILDRLPLPTRLDPATQARAIKYAYHFFFRRMVPLEMFEPVSGWPAYRLRIDSLDELQPGANRGLDVVCDGILNGTDFVYPAEFMPDPQE